MPGEPFVPKPSKEVEMEKIMRSMEVICLKFLHVCCYMLIWVYNLFPFALGYAWSSWHENVFKGRFNGNEQFW